MAQKLGIIFQKEENLLKDIRTLQAYISDKAQDNDLENLKNALYSIGIQMDNLHRIIEKLIKKR